MQLDKLALICVVVPVVIWFFIAFIGALALFPYGFIALIALLVVGYFFYRVIKERIENKEDDYYEKNINK